MRWFWERRRPRWSTPAGYYTPFLKTGDPRLAKAGAREEIYARLFSTADGRAVLADMLVSAGVGSSDYMPGMNRNDSIFDSGAKWHALSVASLAGLDTGGIGRALVSGRLEAMVPEDERDPPA